MTLSMCISLALLWILFVMFYRDYHIDYLRENLFTLRCELFELADNSDDLEFGSPAYGMLRDRINSSIRYAHKMTVVDVICMLIAMRGDVQTQERVNSSELRWKSCCKELSEDVRKKVFEIEFKMKFEVFQHVLVTSLFFWLLVLPAAAFFAVRAAAKQLLVSVLRSGFMVKVFDTFDEAASAATPGATAGSSSSANPVTGFHHVSG